MFYPLSLWELKTPIFETDFGSDFRGFLTYVLIYPFFEGFYLLLEKVKPNSDPEKKTILFKSSFSYYLA